MQENNRLVTSSIEEVDVVTNIVEYVYMAKVRSLETS